MKILDSNEVSCILMGIPIESGRGDEGGDFVEIDYLNDDFVETVSLDGEVTRSKTNDGRADVTLKVMQTSESNKYLSSLRQGDLLAPNGAGVGAMMIRDRQGFSIYTAAQAWIVKAPKVTFGQKASVLEWKIRCAKLLAFSGGN